MSLFQMLVFFYVLLFFSLQGDGLLYIIPEDSVTEAEQAHHPFFLQWGNYNTVLIDRAVFTIPYVTREGIPYLVHLTLFMCLCVHLSVCPSALVRLCVCVSICLCVHLPVCLGFVQMIFWSAVASVTKLGMVVNHHEPECHANTETHRFAILWNCCWAGTVLVYTSTPGIGCKVSK